MSCEMMNCWSPRRPTRQLLSGAMLLAGAMLLVAVCVAQSALSADPLSRYEDGRRAFREYRSGGLLVYYHRRMLDGAIVENDYVVYQFDAATEELVSVRKSWREDLPNHLPGGCIRKQEAESVVDGAVVSSRLYIISPESDVFPLDPPPEHPCWVVRHILDGCLIITIVDAATGTILGNGIPPPHTAFSLSGPWTFFPCSGTWTDWRENARAWFEAMGYPTESVAWPEEDKVRSHIQSGQTAFFYELAHGDSRSFQGGCVEGQGGEPTNATEIEVWIADYAKMPFAFIGSCKGLCLKVDGTFAYEFRKGEPGSSVVVGYCDMAAPECEICWGQSILWQDALFNYMSRGWPVKAALDQANADYPECGEPRCMRFAGDQGFAVVPVVKRDPWPPGVLVVAPNGGEVLEHGTSFEIIWVASDNAVVDSVAIVLSTDGGATFPFTIATGLPDDSSYMWIVPDMDSETARVKVVALDGGMNEGADASDADFTLWGTTSGAEGAITAGVPADWSVEIVGGNPVRTELNVVIGLPEPGHVDLSLYDVAGRALVSMVRGQLPQGYHRLSCAGTKGNGQALGAGVYFLRLDCGEASRTAKVVVAR